VNAGVQVRQRLGIWRLCPIATHQTVNLYLVLTESVEASQLRSPRLDLPTTTMMSQNRNGTMIRLCLG